MGKSLKLFKLFGYLNWYDLLILLQGPFIIITVQQPIVISA